MSALEVLYGSSYVQVWLFKVFSFKCANPVWSEECSELFIHSGSELQVPHFAGSHWLLNRSIWLLVIAANCELPDNYLCSEMKSFHLWHMLQVHIVYFGQQLRDHCCLYKGIYWTHSYKSQQDLVTFHHNLFWSYSMWGGISCGFSFV